MNDCESVIADLDAYRDDVLEPDRRQLLTEHLQECLSCNRVLQKSNDLETNIRAQSEQWKATDDLWRRIKSSVDSSSTSSVDNLSTSVNSNRFWPRYSHAGAIAIVFSVVVAGIIFSQLWPHTKGNKVATVLVSEFHTFVISQRELDFVEPGALAIRQWFVDKLDFRPPMPFKPPGMQLAGARLCNMLDQRIASYMYQSDGVWVSLYIMKSMVPQAAQVSEQILMLNGYGYIYWQNQGLHYSLVGDIPAQQLQRIAKTLRASEVPLQTALVSAISTI